MAQESEVLAVLFTDLVGSTALLSTLGDDAADELRRAHFASCAAHRRPRRAGGQEPRRRADGRFSSAREAVACAAAMQRRSSAHSGSPRAPGGHRRRRADHENGDLFGTPVVVAQRLCDAAAGQVLVSDVVRMLSGRRLSVPLEALGPIQLKGLDEPVVAHAVRWRTAPPRVRLCGGLAVEQEGERLDERLPSRQARMLFALLVLERARPEPRRDRRRAVAG